MSSQRSVRQLVVAVLLGVLIGGGLMAVTPAGAQVSNAVDTSWKKIWNQDLKPLADKRYYTKKKSNAKYSTKRDSAAAQAAATAATDAKLAGYYTKVLADARYVLSRRTTTGIYVAADTAAAAAQNAYTTIEYGTTLAVAPTAVVVGIGATDAARCPGTVELPTANPGFLCIYQAVLTNAGAPDVSTVSGTAGTSRHGAVVRVSSIAAGAFLARGSWAVTPAP